MSTPRKPKALLDAEKKIVELENQLKSSKSQEQSWYKQWQEMKTSVDAIHDVLDDLGIKGHRDENKYQRIPLEARLFAWAMRLSAEKRPE